MAKIGVADKVTLDRIAHALGIAENKIYGIKINKKDSNPATRCTYLMDAVGMTPAKMNFATGKFEYGDWEDVWFVKDNFPCMLDKDGTILYRLNPNDYTLKDNGTASDITNHATANAMSAIPTVYIRQYETGNYKYIYLANYKVSDDFHAYAHEDQNGKVHSYVYLSMFNGVLTGVGNVILRSLSGIQPTSLKSSEIEISYAKANGAGWFVKTWAHRNLLQCLLVMMFCNTNSQSVLGNGNLNYQPSDTTTKGKLPTGTLNNSGQFWGANDNTHQVKAFHIEGVWANVWDRIAGIVNDNGIIRVKMTAPYPTTNLTKRATFKDFEVVGKAIQGTTGGYICDTHMSEYGDIPYKICGSQSTYECDVLFFNNKQLNSAFVGGNYDSDFSGGLYCLSFEGKHDDSAFDVGVSLSYLSGNP